MASSIKSIKSTGVSSLWDSLAITPLTQSAFIWIQLRGAKWQRRCQSCKHSCPSGEDSWLTMTLFGACQRVSTWRILWAGSGKSIQMILLGLIASSCLRKAQSTKPGLPGNQTNNINSIPLLDSSYPNKELILIWELRARTSLRTLQQNSM